MTPLHINIALHFAGSNGPYQFRSATPQGKQVEQRCLSDLVNAGLLIPDFDAGYLPTPRLRAYTDALMNVPLPTPDMDASSGSHLPEHAIGGLFETDLVILMRPDAPNNMYRLSGDERRTIINALRAHANARLNRGGVHTLSGKVAAAKRGSISDWHILTHFGVNIGNCTQPGECTCIERQDETTYDRVRNCALFVPAPR